jgi:hypothetical protein
MLLFLTTVLVSFAAPRVIAIGDLHADPSATEAVLRMTKLMDEDGHWIGGDAVLIQTGDVTDKGPSSRGVITILSRLQTEARQAGGDIIAVLGNHEVMNLVGDWRGVRPADIAEFDAPETRMRDLRPAGVMGQWIQASRMVVFFGGTVYVHGGVSAAMAKHGRVALSEVGASHLGLSAAAPFFGAEGPMWYRGYFLDDEASACANVRIALARLGAHRMVMGHTTQRSGRITTRCEGAIVGIDTGISGYAGHHYAAFELINGNSRAIYPSETLELPDPKNRAN